MILQNVWTGICSNCHQSAKINYQSQDDDLFSVCNHCGALVFKKEVDFISLLAEEISAGVNSTDELVDEIRIKLAAIFPWMEAEFNESFARLLVGQFYTEALIKAESAKNEANDYAAVKAGEGE